MALWGGRFKKNGSPVFAMANRSLPVDRILLRQDIEGSLAHAAMLKKIGLLTAAELRVIQRGLQAILRDHERNRLRFPADVEDVHTLVEQELTRRIGRAGGKLHTARSRNDQVATDTRLYLMGEIDLVQSLIQGVMRQMLNIAERHAETPMPAYTHLQRAQPVTFAHHLLAYLEALQRDAGRFQDCRKRVALSPLGAGACAGSGFKLDREFTARQLKFDAVMRNSMDAVATRDYLQEYLACCAGLGITLSRLAEDLILWSSSEFGFITMSDAVTSGSSLMPQKKNPDAAELLRGKSGRLIGNWVALATAVKGLPLTYNKDLQEDKEAMLDSANTVSTSLLLTIDVFQDMTVHAGRMRAACESGGFMNATALAEYLVRKGMPFREAHDVVGALVLRCEKAGLTGLERMKPADMRKLCPKIGDDVLRHLTIDAMLAARDHTGSPAPKQARREIARWKKTLRKPK